MKTIADIYNNIEKDITKRIESSSEVANTINALNPEKLKEFRSRVFDEYLARPENHIIDTQNPSKTRRLEFSEIEPFLSGEKPQETQGFFSRAGDDLSNIGKAWNAGNFYSEGGWNNLAKNIINGGTPQEREELFQNYLKWESKNQMPENKTWVVPVDGSMNEVSKSPLVQFHGRDTNNNVFNGKETLTESNISQAGNGDFKYSIDEGDYFNKARNELPVDKDSKPNLLDVSGTDAELFQRAEKTFESMPMFTRAADGVKIKLKVSEGGSMAARVVHMISNNSTGQIAPHKLAWLPNVQGTIENAQVRLKGRYDTRKQGRREPNRIYIRRYGDGTIHAVVVSPYGEIVGQDIKSANVITQYPVERIGEIYNAKVDWVNPKMTEAPISKTEASHIKDLSHQGTVPLPKANGSTSKGSTISDSRRLSIPEESETSRESQAKIDEIKTAVEEILAKFNHKAKIKSDVSVVGTLDEARAELGAESIPYNARAVQSGDKVVIIAENITDTDEAVRIFLHEQVGHWGLHKLLKADLRPFLNYVILNYKGSEAWNRIAKYYGNVASDKYVIAEEMLAHIAENRELSDPSMWKRLVHKVKRELAMSQSFDKSVISQIRSRIESETFCGSRKLSLFEMGFTSYTLIVFSSFGRFSFLCLPALSCL